MNVSTSESSHGAFGVNHHSHLSSLVFLVDVLYEVRSDAVWRRLVESSHAESNLEINELLYFLMHFLYVFFLCALIIDHIDVATDNIAIERFCC